MLTKRRRKPCLLLGLLCLTMVFSISPITKIQAASIGAITVCQAGYSTDQLKTAVVVTNGALTDTSYQIVRVSDGTQAASGTMTGYNPSGWTRGETYYKIDFTSLNQTGDFKITSNGVSSNSFTIAGNIWTNYLDEMVEFYRLQRCGVDTNAALPTAGFTNRPSAEALHAACHTDDAKKGSESGTNANMTGGWHDAGDNNKYGGNSWVAGAMAITFLRHSNATFDYDANGVPDLLDEARVGAENVLSIQDAAGVNGGVYDSIDAPNGQHYAWKYPTAETDGVRGNTDDRVGHSRNVSALTYDGSMKSAGSLAAVARAFASRDSAFATRCKTGAINAYNWALSNTGNTGGWYAISDQNNPRFWAAVELYRLTNDTVYGNWITTYLNSLSAIAKVNGTNYWGLQPISLAEYYPVATAAQQTKITSLLATDANGWRNGLAAPFGVTSKINGATFGINEPNISFAADAYRLYEINGDTNLRDAAIAAVQWTFGVNPWNISWVSGVGTKYPTHMHSRLDADGDSNAASTIKLPGFMVAGANWSDPLNSGSTHPWYEDRALANDSNNWKYNEFSISIQYGILDLLVALAYNSGTPVTPTPTQIVTPTPTQVVVTSTPTATPLPTATPTPTQRVTPTPTRRVRVTPTYRVTPTRRVTSTPTQRMTPTPTQSVTPTTTNTPTPTNSPTPTSGGGYLVSYVIQSDWGNGATISITITNKSAAAVNGWTLAWTFPGSQTITNLWSGTYTQSGASVSVKDAGFNANIPGNGGSVNFGCNLNYSGTNAKPDSFTLNGQACQIQ